MNCLCGQSAGKLLFSKDGFEWVRCSDCKLVYLRNPPPQIYDERYFGEEWYSRNKEEWIQQWQPKLDELELFYQKPGKLLDVGCGLGAFPYAAQVKGWNAYGVEIARYAAKYAREEVGLKVYHGTLIEAAFPEKFFDVVTLWEMIEHVPKPIDLLKEIKRILKTDGLLGLSTPNIDSAEARKAGGDWKMLIPTQHLWYFTPDTLRTTLKTAGFKVIENPQGNQGVVSKAKSIAKRLPMLVRLVRYLKGGVGMPHIHVYAKLVQ